MMSTAVKGRIFRVLDLAEFSRTAQRKHHDDVDCRTQIPIYDVFAISFI